MYFDSNLKVSGYYIGLTSCSLIKNNFKYGLIFSEYPVRSKNFDVWSFDYTFLERLLYASHPSTAGYMLDNGFVVPKMKCFESEREMYEIIKPIQDKIMDSFIQICEIFNSSIYTVEDFEQFFCKIHLKNTLCVSRKSLKLQNYLLNAQFENFGHNVAFKEFSKEKFNLRTICKKVVTSFRRYFNVAMIGRVFIVKKMFFSAKLIYRLSYYNKKRKLEKTCKI